MTKNNDKRKKTWFPWRNEILFRFCFVRTFLSVLSSEGLYT
jgi:hypothetical protein